MLRKQKNPQVVKFREDLTQLKIEPKGCRLVILSSCFLKSVTKKPCYTNSYNEFEHATINLLLKN